MTVPKPTLTFATQYADPTLAMRPHFHLLKGFAAHGYDVEVLTTADPRIAGWERLWGAVPLRQVRGRTKRGRLLGLFLRVLAPRRDQITVSFVWDWHAYALALRRLLFGCPYAIFLDTFIYRSAGTASGRLRESLRYGWVLRRADVILAEAPPSLERARQSFPWACVLPAPPCFWRRELEGVEAGWVAEGYDPPRRPVILYAGRLVRRKNVHDLIAAFAGPAARYPDWSVELRGIAADAAYDEELRAQVETLGLTGRVRFLPPVFGDALYRLYRETAIFCLPSEGEGLPTVLMEAMYFGGAIVAARSGFLPYQLGDGEAGLLHPPRDVAGLAARLEQFMASPETRAAYQARARRRLLQTFTWEVYFPDIAAEFSRLLRRAPAPE